MPAYRRRNFNDVWHWKKDCAEYPAERPYQIAFTKPISGKLCEECEKMR
jgi:hypothetical protein